jgi:hypothetical protein
MKLTTDDLLVSFLFVICERTQRVLRRACRNRSVSDLLEAHRPKYAFYATVHRTG